MCPAKLELYIIYIYLLLRMQCHKGKTSLGELYPILRILNTSGARMFSIQMIELTVFADQSIEFLIPGTASQSVLS